VIARSVAARGVDAVLVAKELGEKLVAPDLADLALVIVFADSAVDQPTLARETRTIFGAIPVVGCSTTGAIGSAELGAPGAVALGLYGTGVRVGLGVATELSSGAEARTRAAVEDAAASLGLSCETLDPERHVMVTLFEGSGHMDEPFCFASAVSAPQLRAVGGAASARANDGEVRHVFANGEALADAGIVIVLEPGVKFETLTSSHLVPTELRCVVTGATGRTITELDGLPAIARFGELVGKLGGTLGPATPGEFTFARFVDGIPYVRALTSVLPDALELGCSVDIGHVLRIMRPGDLVAQTSRDLAAAAERLGSVSAVLAFSCTFRNLEAELRGVTEELEQVYERFGEQAGMLFVNHTLTALVLGGGEGG
jgi:hypothetical protein